MIMSASVERVIITYGTFDLFHPGHVLLLKRAKELGTKLIVGLSTDEFNAIKGKKSVMTYEDRKVVLESCRYVDEVFAEETWEQKADDIKKFGADIFVMGDDWKGKFDNLSKSCKVHYLGRTPLVSSTSIKEKTVRSLSSLNMHQA
jgi:glycerol-3-phosphate cytidylyltransferase